MTDNLSVQKLLIRMVEERHSLLDLLPEEALVEKLLSLALVGPPPLPAVPTARLQELARALNRTETKDLRLVVFGGGTGLANLIGGDSRDPLWPQAPFSGLKELFPLSTAVVCVTDDGGSTGELLKDLPLIALGDIRHVLLASVRRESLQQQYGLDEAGALAVCALLHRLFNHRFDLQPESSGTLLVAAGADLDHLPRAMAGPLRQLLEVLFSDPLAALLVRPHCLGNLLLAAAIHRQGQGFTAEATTDGIRFLAELIGAGAEAVFPCTSTPAQLKILYGNGVLVSGEAKSGNARRGQPMNRVFVEFSDQPKLPAGLLAAIAAADLILFAPGSLFTSIVPVLQVPGIAAAVRANRRALKILVANLWVQAGETDHVHDDPQRRFHTSDLLAAYHRNIPGGIEGLFEQLLVFGLRDIPGSILRNYALENKEPIHLDREQVLEMGFSPIEARLGSQEDIDRRGVIQHDPAALASAIRVLWALRNPDQGSRAKHLPQGECRYQLLRHPLGQTPARWYAGILARLSELTVEPAIRPVLAEILWRHRDIPLAHLERIKGVSLLGSEDWSRVQAWDNIYSFYDPADRLIRIRRDSLASKPRFEAVFLVALGQSLLGDYAAEKAKHPVERDGELLGYEFRLVLRPESERQSFFSAVELNRYLALARMRQATGDPLIHTRLVNNGEGFTPPGLLFGLTYAWYLDNRQVPHVEYKMSIGRMAHCGLIPEQQRMARRRQELIDFFRTTVFGYDDQQFGNGSRGISPEVKGPRDTPMGYSFR